MRAVYEKLAPWLTRLRLTPDRPDYDPVGELVACGAFTDVREHHFPFTTTYTTDAYLRLVGTYSFFRALPDALQAAVLDGLRQTIDSDCGGVYAKPYDGYLVTATVA